MLIHIARGGLTDPWEEALTMAETLKIKGVNVAIMDVGYTHIACGIDSGQVVMVNETGLLEFFQREITQSDLGAPMARTKIQQVPIYWTHVAVHPDTRALLDNDNMDVLARNAATLQRKHELIISVSEATYSDVDDVLLSTSDHVVMHSNGVRTLSRYIGYYQLAKDRMIVCMGIDVPTRYRKAIPEIEGVLKVFPNYELGKVSSYLRRQLKRYPPRTAQERFRRNWEVSLQKFPYP